MKKSLLFSAAALAAVAAQAQMPAQEYGRVLSSTPVIQQVAVPRQVCSQQPVVMEQPSTGGAGSAIGALAGGILGNTIGHGGGRAAATVIGAVTGAVVGNNLENRPAYAQNVQQCSTQTYYENRTVGYNVTYEYAGRQYTVQMPNDPGPNIRLQVTPVGAADPVQQPYADGYAQPQPIVAPPAIQSSTVIVPSTAVYPAVYPVYYPRPYYYPPVGVSLNFGYSRGGHRHHGHWR